MSEAVVQVEGLRESPRTRRRVSVMVVASVVFLAIVVVVAVLGSVLAPRDPNAQDVLTGLSGPSGEHLLGTDDLGRDMLSRLIVGARTALLGPLVIALGSSLIGNALGLLAGYRGGALDSLIMRWVDLMWAIPGLLLIVVVVGAIGGGYWLAVVLLLVLSIPFDTRVIRGATLEQVPRPYVEAARALGVPGRRIMLLHIWPNVASVAVANTCLVFASSLVGLSGLSFLGMGVSPGTPDWGLMLSEGRDFLLLNPTAVLAPGVLIACTAAAMNLIGDWLYEHLSSKGATR